MGNKTKISWTADDDGVKGASWNHLRGCSRTISEGTKQSGCGSSDGGGCYAELNGWRFAGPGLPYEGLVRMTPNGPRWTGVVRFVDEHLLDPVRWSSPRRIFTTSVSGPFHEKLTNQQIAIMYGVQAATPWHTYQTLTKRSKRRAEWFSWVQRASESANDGRGMSPAAFCFVLLQHYVLIDNAFSEQDLKSLSRSSVVDQALSAAWPLPNCWEGISCENQHAYMDRAPHLASIEGIAVKFLSLEPLLGDIDLGSDEWDWIIVGVESGNKARPCDVEWLRSIRDQCEKARIPMFLKQATASEGLITLGARSTKKKGDLIELPYLDGVQHREFPKVSP